MTLTSITTGVAGYAILRIYKIDQATFSPSDASRASNDTRPCVWRKIGTRHLCGTLPRDFHWAKFPELTPRAPAASLINCQSNESVMVPMNIDDLSSAQEQFVKRPAKSTVLQFVMFSDDDNSSERAFDERAAAMIVRYQKAKDLTHNEMATFLGGDIDANNYISYVRRKKFPAYLIWRFCKFTGLALDGVPAEGKTPANRTEKRRKLIALTPLRTGGELK